MAKKNGKKSKSLKNKKAPSILMLNNSEFKDHVKESRKEGLGLENHLTQGELKIVTRKSFTPEITIVKDPTDNEKALMKEVGSDTLVQFTISTGGIDRDEDTIAVAGWDLSNFVKNPVVPWAHNYGEPPVAKAIATWVEDNALKSRAIFTSKDLYPFGDMVGKMYKQGFLSAVSVGFNPTKFVFVDDKERKFGIDFLEQELMEYSAVPVPSNPEALIEARSKGIDLAPMKTYFEEMLSNEGTRKTLDMEVIDNLMKILNTSITTIGKGDVDDLDIEISDSGEDTTDGTEHTSASDADGTHNIPDTTEEIESELDSEEETDSEDNEETENEESVGELEKLDDDWEDWEATVAASSSEHLIKSIEVMLKGNITYSDNKKAYGLISKILRDKYNIETPDFKYVDAKVLKNFPERYGYSLETGQLKEKTQREIESDAIKQAEEIIKACLVTIREYDPEYKFKEADDFTIDLVIDDNSDQTKSDDENVFNFDDFKDEGSVKDFIKDQIDSSKITFDKLTGKLGD